MTAVTFSPLAGAGWQFFDDDGVPLAGGFLYSYEAGGTTPASTYIDSSGDTTNANPIVLDAAGRIDEEVWLDSSLTYKFRLFDSLLNEVWTKDNIPGILTDAVLAESDGSDLIGFIQAGTGAVARTAQDKMREVVTSEDFGGTRGAYNVGLGIGVLGVNVSGAANTGVGYSVLAALTTGNYNTGLGEAAFLSLTTGSNNTAVGRRALTALTTGGDNTAVGYAALFSQTTAFSNTAVGSAAGYALTTGAQNVAVGYNALLAGTTALGNTAVGYRAGLAITTGQGNTLIGYDAGKTQTSVNNVTAVGSNALATNTATAVTAVGQSALAVNTTGVENVAVGYASLSANTTGQSNTAVGNNALNLNVTGNSNVAVGTAAGAAMTGSSGTFIGTSAGLSVTGASNTVVGAGAAPTLTTGNTNTVIGYLANTTAAAVNCTSLGNAATCTGDNQITLGNASVATLRCQQTSITALSDARDKDGVENLNVGLAFINTLRPVDFIWNTRDKSLVGKREAGFIAQELKAASEAAGLSWLGLVDETNPERLEATPGKLLPVLVKAIQQLSARVAELEDKACPGCQN